MSFLSSVRREWFSNVRGDVLSGIVVALALIPEAIGFSVIAGVDPKLGLYASVVIACVIAFVGGRPAMISAATAATAVLMTDLVRDHGVQYLFAATALMGFLQVIAGFLKLGRLMRFVSQSVITGFVNSLAILIFLAQLPQLINVSPATYWLIALGLAIIYVFPRITRVVPSPLVAIAVLTGITVVFELDVRTVAQLGELPTGLPTFALPSVPLTFETLGILFPVAVTLAAVGLLESLLTAQIIDDKTDTMSNKNRECVGQGVANVASAMLGGMGGCAMIGQSVINVTSGGRGRLSTLTRRSVSPRLARRAPGFARNSARRSADSRDDNGLSQHLLLEVRGAASSQSMAVVGGNAGDSSDGRRDRRPFQGCARRCPTFRCVLCRQGIAP